MCLLDYDYKILNKAFLVHKPGIKKRVYPNEELVNVQEKLIRRKIERECRIVHKRREKCML